MAQIHVTQIKDGADSRDCSSPFLGLNGAKKGNFVEARFYFLLYGWVQGEAQLQRKTIQNYALIHLTQSQDGAD
jgi:hypothetical protein